MANVVRLESMRNCKNKLNLTKILVAFLSLKSWPVKEDSLHALSLEDAELQTSIIGT